VHVIWRIIDRIGGAAETVVVVIRMVDVAVVSRVRRTMEVTCETTVVLKVVYEYDKTV